ncbi:hypothetical protein ACE6ZS_003147 [Salmonella enterica]|nr:hypothetical protein [Salmonella enterica subsp. enterica serovar Javiana]EFS2016169.1 hypothetical protein [Salmonella enterica]EEK7937685.1 hypothetical protein [Salmonella enterica subsp. enterica serovar Javiana]EEK8079765.1 hypothetical protein [Salmonella enterica subsp. enterica serovar Javiana]EEK8085726.1 hypothetical protein [Salmonella enterica subsp. enterica serovar Javiana]
MSIEYHLIVNSSLRYEVFKEIKASFGDSDLYCLKHFSDNVIGFSINGSSSDWGADFEITKTEKDLFIAIHSGNYKKILSVIENRLINNHISFELEEE